MTEVEKAVAYLEACADGYDPEFDRSVELVSAALRREQERSTNTPLILEILRLPQLRQMEGERVMVIRMGVMTQSEPAAVKKNGHCISDSGCRCYAELYGETWIAYRRPPEQ